MKYLPSKNSTYIYIAIISTAAALAYTGYSKYFKTPDTSQEENLSISETTPLPNAAVPLGIDESSSASASSQPKNITNTGPIVKLSSVVVTSARATFAIIGDYGLESSNEAGVADLVKSWNPDFIITVGDNNYENGAASTIDANIGQYYHNYIYPYTGSYGTGASSNKFFPCIGNHDLITNNGSPYYQYFTLPGNERYYDYVKGNIHFFVLDSDPSEPDGTSSTSTQGVWLKNKLQASTSKWNVVYFHNPPYCSDAVIGSQAYMRWPFKSWGAHVVLVGHSHVYERLMVGGLLYFVNGLGGRNIHGFKPSPLPETVFRYNSNYGAMLCKEYTDSLSFKFYNKSGTLIDTYYLTNSQNVLNAVISSPLNNASFSVGSPITINASASGSTGTIQKIEFFAGAVKLGEDVTSPYSFLWNDAPAGNYALTAKVTDSGNNTAVSAVINITVVNTLTASITSPANNASFNTGSAVVINAAASGGTGTIQKVEFFAGAVKLGEDLTSPYSFSWNNAAAGNYALTGRGTDSGNNTVVSAVINISVANTLAASITSPANNASFNTGSAVVINAAASGGTGTIQKVEFFAGTVKLGEDLTSPYSFSWNNAAAGNYALTAKVTDSGNNTVVSAVINISVANTLAATITSPANNASFNTGSAVVINAAASGGTGRIQKVEFFAGAVKLGEDLASPYTFRWNNAAAGNYALTAKVTDNGNNTAVSAVKNIIVTNTLTASIITPVNNSSFSVGSSVAIQASASGGTGTIQKVEFFAGAVKLGEDLASPYSFTWNNAAAGNYALTAKVTDNGNNTAVSAIINITIKLADKLITAITSPVNNASFSSDSVIIIQAAVSGGSGAIQKVEFFAGAVKLGEDLTSPYSFKWNNVPAGLYDLTAKAADSLNNTAVSAVINITVTNPFTASITSPANNASFRADTSISIHASATGGKGKIQKIEFFAGAAKLGEDLLSPYDYIWENASAGIYLLTAKATDSLNNNAVSSQINITVNPTDTAYNVTGTISREVWNNVSGTLISSIPITTPPSLTEELSIFQSPQSFGDNYGQRIRGYVCAPETGNYIFWIASDDNSELWLSTNEKPDGKVKIAYVSGSTSPRQWTKYSSQKSASIYLIKGQKYYIEALHKEGTMADNCAVGWQLPSGIQERPIPGSRLSQFETPFTPPSIELISAGGSWKYLDNGSNQGTAWRTASLNDASWKTGNAELGYGDGGEATVVSFGPSATNKYITTYFRKTFDVTDISAISGLELNLIRDDGAVIYINGVEVYRNNLPGGTIYYNTLAPTYIDGDNESTFLLANISSASLINGTNLIAVEIHQNAVTSSDISFNLKLNTLSGLKILNIPPADDSHQENPILENTYDMIVYPNPNTGQFSLELCVDDLLEKTLVIEVTDSYGTVIYKNQPKKINGCIKESIELKSNLPVGVYFMKVSIDDKIQTSKILLTK